MWYVFPLQFDGAPASLRKSEMPSGWCCVKTHGIEASPTLDTANDALWR